MISLDLETTGLNWRKDKIIGVASYHPSIGTNFYKWPYTATATSIPTVWHNFKFDAKFLKHNGSNIDGEIHDTMLLSYVLDPEREGGHSLANLSKVFLGQEHREIKDLLGTGKNKRRLEDIPFDELAEKSKTDVKHTYELFHVLKAKCSPTLWQLYEKLEIPTMLALVDMEMTGIPVDVEYLKWLRKTTRHEIWKALKNLRQFPHINYNSPKQVGELLYRKLRLPVQKKTDKQQPSTDTEVLKVLAEIHDFPRHLLVYREANKRLNTYIQPLLEEQQDGIIWPNFNQHVTATGRLSSSNPINFQNIPHRTEAGNRIRQSIVPRSGKVLLEADYSQIEPRLMAHFSKDPNLIKLFQSGNDLYTGVVKEVLQCSEAEAKQKRPLGKLLFLAMGYGAQPKKLVKAAKKEGVDITEEEAEVFIKKAEITYSILFQYKASIISKASQEGKVTTMCGRVRYIKGLKDPNKWVRMAAQREAFNTVIQGSAADILKMALVRLHKFGWKMLLTVHDSVLIDMSQQCMEHNVQDHMENIVKLRVPLKVDIKVANAWGGNRESMHRLKEVA